MRKIIYTSDRQEWREWLETHFETEIEVWFVFPMKESNEESISYNDAVEEALCFGWIDSTISILTRCTVPNGSHQESRAVHTRSPI